MSVLATMSVFKILVRNFILYLSGAAFMCAGACSETVKPPYIKAQVIDVYNNKTDIYNAHFLYWWQERGETAFLDTHECRSRRLMTNTADPQAVANGLTPLRMHLQDIAVIEWTVNGMGKKMLVLTKRGDRMEAICTFPRELQVNSDAGLADYKRFIIGSTVKNTGRFDFKLDLDMTRSITVIGITPAP